MDPEIRAIMLKALGDLGADWKAAADDALRALEVTKLGYTLPVSAELLMDEGLIPDTRLPEPRLPWWLRARRSLRWWTADRRLRFGVWLGSRIAGQDLDPDQYEEW